MSLRGVANSNSNFVDQSRSQFEALLAKANAGEKAFRQKAWEQYSLLGLPGRKTETWKYSSLAHFTREAWDLAPANLGSPSAALQKITADLNSRWGKEFDLVILVDGLLRPDLSTLKSGLSVLSLDEPVWNFEDGWIGLSAALARPGYQLNFADGFKAAKPILLTQIQTTVGTWSPSVNRICIGAGAAVEIAEIFLGTDGRYLRSELTSVDVGAGSSLNWVRVQQESPEALHFSEVQSRLEERAVLSLIQLNGGSSWCRSTLRASIEGEGAEAHISGLTFARLKQHIDQRVQVRHAKGHSVSSQLFKGVLKDQARGVLNGKILIERDAQKVSSMQVNHNLLLSPTAEADTKPELEIYADDVKANHGASIGRLDEDKVFYLMSRGIPRALAQQMLAHAFVGDVLMKIDPRALRSFADACVQDWLPNFSVEMEHSISAGEA